MNKNYVVYKHTSPSGKAYVGQTCNYVKRCNSHKRVNSHCSAFNSAIKKHGWDNFKHEILKENLTLKEANFWEEFYIKEFNSLSPHGYNLNTGGDNKRSSEASKLKITGRFLGENSTSSKSYVAISNSGDIYKFTGIFNFCRSRGMSGGSLAAVAAGNRRHYCGWKCFYSYEWDSFSDNEKTALLTPIDLPNTRRNANQKRSSKYVCISPSGEVIYIENLSQFSRENNLGSSSMNSVAHGKESHHKGWNCFLRNDWDSFDDNRKSVLSRPVDTAYHTKLKIEKMCNDYVCISPDNNVLKIKNLKSYCREHDLNVGNMVAVAKGKRKHANKWRCYYLDDWNKANEPTD